METDKSGKHLSQVGTILSFKVFKGHFLNCAHIKDRLFSHCYASADLPIENNLGFNVLIKNASTHEQEEPGTKSNPFV